MLTPRLFETLVLVAEGWSNPELAKRLDMPMETVKSRVHELLAALGARSRTHAVTLAFRRRLLSVDEP